jgi:RHS repeat-associated protein
VADDTFTFDALGRMTARVTQEVDPVARTVVPHTLELTWDASSNLVKTVPDDAEVVYVYDGSGQRVAQMGVAAATATAYLGATEVTDPDTAAGASGDLTGTRFYALGGATVATRTGSSLSFLFGDVQGSAQVMVTHTVALDGTLDAISENSVSRNAYAPYGTTRGAGTSAVNDGLAISRGWLNQVSDEASTGLVYLNARYYDPAVARFVSPDPLMNPEDPKTLDPYRYAENNPISFKDATGLFSCPAWIPQGVCEASNNAAAARNNAGNSSARARPAPLRHKKSTQDAGLVSGIYMNFWLEHPTGDEIGDLVTRNSDTTNALLPLGIDCVASSYRGGACAELGRLALTLDHGVDSVRGLMGMMAMFPENGEWDMKRVLRGRYDWTLADVKGEVNGAGWLHSRDGKETRYDTYGNAQYGYMLAGWGISYGNALLASNGPGTVKADVADDLAIAVGYNMREDYPNGISPAQFSAYLETPDVMKLFENAGSVRDQKAS